MSIHNIFRVRNGCNGKFFEGEVLLEDAKGKFFFLFVAKKYALAASSVLAMTVALMGTDSAKAQSTDPDYEKETTGNTEHGYSQFSGNTFFNDMTIRTAGGQADGVRTANWGPKITVNTLDVTTTGSSADGINVSRDGEGTIVTVRENARISTQGGMGVRSTTTVHATGGVNKIIFNGSSQISTTGAGSGNGGHAVYAGVDLLGCGPLSLPLYDCRSSNGAEVALLGDAGDLHVITTAGNGANAVYAYGRGHIDLGNVDIATSGNGAHGIVAQRRSSQYYYDSSTSGPQDYSGTIRLLGDVRVTVSGDDSYAFLVDSFSATNGADSEGTVAEIATDRVNGKDDPIYHITGNMLATNSGILDLQMANGSVFTGATTASNNGTLDLDISGPDSLWTMTGDSSLSNLSLSDGATLRLEGDGTDPVAYNLTGAFKSMGGVIDLSSNGLAGDQLILTGSYIGENDAMLVLDTMLTDSGALSDRIVNDGGTITGQTLVRINNTDPSGEGGDTEPGHGIKIVRSINGGTTSDDAFLLDASASNAYEFEGRTVVGAGAYAYSLHKGANPNNPSLTDEYGEDQIDEDWYLRSQLDDDGGDQLYTAAVPLYEAYPQLLLGMNGLPTLQQRVGNRFWSGAGALNLSAGASGNAAQGDERMTQSNGIWGRVEGSRNFMRPKFSTSGTDYDYDIFTMQAGLEGLFHDSDNGKLIGSITGHYNRGKADITSIHGQGIIKTDGYGGGLTLTWYGDDGFYFDTQAQVSWYDSKLKSSLLQQTIADGNKGFGYAFSGEAGKSVPLSEHWSLTPQAQLSYSYIRFDDMHDIFDATISKDKGSSLLGRLGLSFDYQNTRQNAAGMTDRNHLYAIVNLYNEFLDGTRVNVDEISFTSQRERLWGGIGLGGSYSWDDGKYSFFGEASANTSLSQFGDSSAFKGTMGLRVKW